MIFVFAGVCLLDNPYSIDGIYDYEIPPHLAEEVVPGAFVTVPFGISNRRLIGLVVEVRDQSKYKEHKLIEAVCPDTLSLSEEMLGLCDFMKYRTLCATGDAVRAMVPASALSRLVVYYSVSPDHTPPTSDDLRSSDLFVYQHIAKKREASLTDLRRELGYGVESTLRQLTKQGYLTRRVELKEPSAGLCETLWSPALSPDTCEALIAGRECNGIKLSSQKQRDVLRVLCESDEPLPALSIKEQAHVTDAPIKSLSEKGVIASQKRRIDRNPYASARFVGQTPIALSDEQASALETLSSLAFSGEAKAALLYGVTGSGKTSVMTSLIDRLLEEGKGVILLLPEIALTPQSVSIFCARYGNRVAVIHSGLSSGERYDAYCRIRDGGADVVIGTRSAVFAPVKNLGAIIIDEEQEHTYKSDQNPKYHARDIARYRCAHHKALMLLASATPSLESYRKAEEGIYTLVKLTKRYGNAKLPRVEVVDMRRESAIGNLSPIGSHFAEELCRVTASGEQSVLFLNRRGYNHFVSCRSCGEAILCPSCSVAMTYHTRRGTYADGDLVCHWCGRRQSLPRVCPSCKSEHLSRTGYGTQRVEEELSGLLPQARVLRMDADTTTTKTAYDDMLTSFRRHEADILLGTQMVTKGHDFPDVTLVGVLLADASLYLDDYRASERTFAMLTQVIGRAGRGDKPGLAIVQTNNPDSEIIRLAKEQDYESFYKREIKLRKLLVFPPFCDIALLTLTHHSESELLQATAAFERSFRELAEGEFSDVALVSFGPFEAPVYRVDNKYRMRMVVKCKLNRRTLEFFSRLVCLFSDKTARRISVSVDFNPTNL
ncbi:MAG: primosomal protein N' [Clostridia bacterium]|nr:primosomal protein N' [Clostridia bacterium]